MSDTITSGPTAGARPIEVATGKVRRACRDLAVAEAELHLTNTAMHRSIPLSQRHGDLGRAMEQNTAIEGKVRDAAEDLHVVSELLKEEVTHRVELERELAAAQRRH